ncbi:kinase-like protein [Viridothelium virens]|uniref:Kinase-like protein n=1 Tax=Viridothelium virens TaxID=1048519 RepID=A0A6A6GYE0_VIRVR|nr:kinase-like protein [Viridothelium virens]
MALKSYSSGMRTVYNWEKDAFFALRRDDSRAIVNYFGSYSHDEPRETPEGIVNDTTYNILLEYGQMDLDEYCADLANVPPVRAMEVIRFWESFCTIADAIRRVHNFRIRQGKQENFYNGWHADIKPDNILVVNGEFRLADFGFAKFSETVKNTTLPTEYIEGGTDTYGAPEFARMKQSGTRTTVTQTIDTWSFGCVLSVVAAWIILGFQGIRQYEMLRKMANSRLGVNTDRFHDGNDLLPEIKDWHDFLRTHMRTSDTATPLILELIETRMLRAHPEDRHESEKLCKELASLKQRATREHDDKKVRETEGCVKKALLVMDKYAVLQDDKTSRVDGLHVGSRLHVNIIDEGPKPSQFHMPVQTQNHESNRAGKDKRMLDVPYAKTPHRKEILEEEMKDIRLLFGMSEEGMPSEPFSKHFGETTDSPINDTPPQKAGERWGGRLTPRNPASRSISPVYRVPIPPPASRPSGSIENEAFSEPRIPARGISPAPSQAPG